MTIDEMPRETARRIINMIAYGCLEYGEGFTDQSYFQLLCRMRGLIKDGEKLPEFDNTNRFSCLHCGYVDDPVEFDIAGRLTMCLGPCCPHCGMEGHRYEKYLALSGDEIDQAAYDAAERLCK